jgi:hypothetical protein
MQEVTFLQQAFARGQHAVAEACDIGNARAGGRLDLGERPTNPLRADRHLRDDDAPGRVGQLRQVTLGEEAAQHLIGGPLDRRHSGYAEALVDLGSPRVVDPGHDVLHPERLAGNARRENVGVVTTGDGCEGVCRVDPGLAQRVAIEPHPRDGPPIEGGPEPSKGRLLLIDDRHIVAASLEGPCDGGAHSTASHDHEVHVATLHRHGSAPTIVPAAAGRGRCRDDGWDGRV